MKPGENTILSPGLVGPMVLRPQAVVTARLDQGR